MPLPNFDAFQRVWVEKTKSSHGHGGTGWEFGTCLWSPTTDKSGKHIYKNMTAAQDGDLVLHFYKDAPYGKQTDHYFCGISAVDGVVEIRNEQPPLPGEWAGQSQYYRLSLRNFSPLADALPLRKFVQQYDKLACTRFRRHRVRCFDGAGGGSWRPLASTCSMPSSSCDWPAEIWSGSTSHLIRPRTGWRQ
jgi:hypothetical protein